MKELTVGKNDAGQRLDRFLGKAVPLLPSSLCQKYLRCLYRCLVSCHVIVKAEKRRICDTV